MKNMRSFTQWKQASSNDEVLSFKNYVNTNEALVGDDAHIFRNKGDFLSLAEEKEQGYLDTLFNRLPDLCLSERISRVLRLFGLLYCGANVYVKVIFRSPAQSKVTDPNFDIRNSKRVDTYVRLMLTLLSVTLFMAPTALLLFIDGHGTLKYSVIVMCTFLFSVALNIGTQGRRVRLGSC